MTGRNGRGLAIAAPLIAVLASSGASADGDRIAWCLDVARDLVTRRAPDACAGRIVDDAEAAGVRARRLQRIRRGLDGHRQAVPGRRMGASGTGFFVAADGTLVTSAHVVAGCPVVTAAAAGGGARPARLLGLDAEADLALMRTDIVPRSVAEFGAARDPAADEPIAVVGFPMHGRVAIRPILVTGHVLGRARAGPRAGARFRLRADVRGGNSGGPVLDRRGLILGVVSAKVHTPRTFRKTGRVVRDVGVAIASETVIGFLAAHDQPYRLRADAAPMSDAEIIASARLFVVRLVCWR